MEILNASSKAISHPRVLPLCMIILIVGCSITSAIYSGKKGEKFDMGKTVGLALGAALAYELAKSSGGGNLKKLRKLES
jgi:hypothetical protein